MIPQDWGTSRCLKLAALLVIFNSRAAAVASLTMSLLIGILRISGAIPDRLWTCFAGRVL